LALVELKEKKEKASNGPVSNISPPKSGKKKKGGEKKKKKPDAFFPRC